MEKQGMSILKFLVIFFFSFTLHAKPNKEQAFVFKKGPNNKVEFLGHATPGFASVPGTGGYLEGTIFGDLTSFNGELTVKLKEFDTGIALRTKHMNEKFLQTDKYPEAKLKLSRFSPVKNGEKFDWEGNIKIKNKVKVVKGTATVTGKRVQANFSIDTNDFDIGAPCWLSVCFGKDVDISVDATAI